MNAGTLKVGAAFKLRHESGKNMSTLENGSHQLQARTQLKAARPDHNNVTHHAHLVLIQHLGDAIAFHIFYELGKGQQDIVANIVMPAEYFLGSLKFSSGNWQHTSPLLSSVRATNSASSSSNKVTEFVVLAKISLIISCSQGVTRATHIVGMCVSD